MIIDKKEYMENREKLDEIFDLIVDESDLTNKLYNSRINNKNCSENLDKSIYKMLNNLGMQFFKRKMIFQLYILNLEALKIKLYI